MKRAESDRRRTRMATDKDEGLLGGASDIVGGATDGLRETTTGALGGGGP